MSIYRMLMFINHKMIYVLEAMDNRTLRQVGFQGNEYYLCEDETDIDFFCEELTDHYNIDSFSELTMYVYLVDCHANKDIKLKLIHKLSECSRLNVINLEDAIPPIITQKDIRIDTEGISVSFLGDKYNYIISDDNYFIGEEKDNNNQIELSFEDFIVLMFWKNNSHEKELNKYKDICEMWKNKYKELEFYINEQKENIAEADSTTQDIISRRRVIEVSVSTHARIIREQVRNGAIVSANQSLGYFISQRNAINRISTYIYAPRAGKLVWSFLDGDTIPIDNSLPDKEELVIVGVIGDESDSLLDMKKWAKTQVPRNIK